MVTHKETFVKQKFIFNSCAEFLIDKFKIIAVKRRSNLAKPLKRVCGCCEQMRLPFEIHLGAAALNFLVEAVGLCTL